MQIIVVKNRDGVISKLMDLIQNIAEESITNNGIFTIGLSGGSLGSFLATGLPKVQSDFSKWKLFFCDERVVPEDNNDSTFGFYKTALIGSTKLKEEQFIKIKQGVSVKEAAEDYEQQLQMHFPEGEVPRFDLLLLGMGPDGHTCSLFPNHPLLKEKEKWIAAISDSPKPPPERVTMTFKVINNSKNCIFAMCGNEKAAMAKRILKNKEDLPATKVNPTNGEVYWVLDEEAAKEIN